METINEVKELEDDIYHAEQQRLKRIAWIEEQVLVSLDSIETQKAE